MRLGHAEVVVAPRSAEYAVATRGLSFREWELSLRDFATEETLWTQDVGFGIRAMKFTNRGELVVLSDDMSSGEITVSRAPDFNGTAMNGSSWGDVTYKAHLSDSGRVVAAVYSDGTLASWDAQTGALLQALTIEPAGIIDSQLSPAGRLLAVSRDDWTVEVWSLNEGRLITTMEGHTGDILAMDFSPDSSRLLTGSTDATAKLWDSYAGEEITTFTGHGGPVSAVAFSVDGEFIATGGTDDRLLVRHLILDPTAACELVRHEVREEQLIEALGGAEPKVCTNLL